MRIFWGALILFFFLVPGSASALNEEVLQEPFGVHEEGEKGNSQLALEEDFLNPPASVNISGESGLGSRENIDRFLGEFENPFSSPQSTYQGTRSEDKIRRQSSK